jgi:hypothetical protein
MVTKNKSTIGLTASYTFYRTLVYETELQNRKGRIFGQNWWPENITNMADSRRNRAAAKKKCRTAGTKTVEPGLGSTCSTNKTESKIRQEEQITQWAGKKNQASAVLVSRRRLWRWSNRSLGTQTEEMKNRTAK